MIAFLTTSTKGRAIAAIMSRGATVATSSTIVEKNPFLEQAGTPKFSKLKPENLGPAVDSLLVEMERNFADFEQSLTSKAIKYDDVLPEIEKIQAPLEYAWGVAGHLKGVNDSEELRTVYQKSQPDVVKSFTKFSQSKELYDALIKIQDSWKEVEDVDGKLLSFEEQQKRRAVENSLRSMVLGGVALEGTQKERFNEIKLRLAEISTKFSNNVLDATKAFSLTIEDADIMKDVPKSACAMWAQAHEKYINDKSDGDHQEVDLKTGPWRVTLDGPSYINAMQFLPDRNLREAIYRAFTTRASESNGEDGNNVPLIAEILKLRAESSKILNYDCYAERSLAAKMAPSVQSVRDLAALIADKALPAAICELQEITQFANSKVGDDAVLEKLMPWDIPFWSERYREEKFTVTKEELRPYFSLPLVLEGLFGLAQRLFDVEIKAADGDAEIWNGDVQYYNVCDISSGERIASFYLDPYARPSNKRGGAWMGVCLGKSKALDRSTPVAYLNCNGSPPVGDTPSLMTFAEVKTLFHEFGHGLQHMLTNVNIGSVSGIRGVEWDAVELPSQFMENFLYDKTTIYGFAKHYKTGEVLPEDIFGKLLKQKTFCAGLGLMRQLYLGQMDLEFHSTFDPETENIFDLQQKMAKKFQPHNMPLETDRFLCTFTHIFAGGYAAGYYSYKWAEVMSADAFGAFEDVIDDEEAFVAMGRKFRRTVLGLGGAVHPSDVFREFRGRDPSPDALLRHNGLI